MVSGLQLTILRTRDMGLVKQLWGDPSIYHLMSDDGCPSNPAKWQPVDSDRRVFLVPWLYSVDKPPQPMGLVSFYAVNYVMYEVHIGLLPAFHHTLTYDLCIKAKNWMFENTPCQSIIAYVPASKPHVRALAIKCGMLESGILPKSLLVQGVLIDQYVFSIGRD